MDNRRKTVVINKPFQYQHTVLVAAIAVMLVNGFVIIRMLFPGDNPLALSSGMMMGMAAVEVLLIATVWYGSLYLSHRIAGPVYVFARAMSRLGSGDISARISLRQNDMFQSEAEEINKGIAALRTRIETIKDLSDQLQQAQAAGGDIGATVDNLASELSIFTTGTEK